MKLEDLPRPLPQPFDNPILNKVRAVIDATLIEVIFRRHILCNLSYCICRAGFIGNLRKLSNVNKEFIIFEIFEIFYEALDFQGI